MWCSWHDRCFKLDRATSNLNPRRTFIIPFDISLRNHAACARMLLFGACAGLALLALHAHAADIKVDVTGSNLRQAEGEGALPVQVITRTDLTNQGVQTAQEILDKISANMSFGSFNEAGGVGSSFTGFTGASLRGLGYQRTLVLLNGRRIAPYAQSGGQGVDLNAIPVSALARVEILKDGASAIYGADAIAGVINFILRTDYEGYEAYSYYGNSQDGGGQAWRINGTAGKGNLARDGWNAFVTFDYLNQDAVTASQRAPWGSSAFQPGLGVDALSSNSYPANIDVVTPGGTDTRNPGNPACQRPYSFPTPTAPLRCQFDYVAYIDLLPPSQKWNVVGNATFQINADHQAWIEGTYYNATYQYRIAPAPISSATGYPILLQPSSAFYPAAFIAGIGGDPTQPINVRWRSLELGPRTDEPNVQQARMVAGLRGLVDGWDYVAAGNFTQNIEKDKYTDGYASASLLMPLLNSGNVNFFGPNTPDIVNQMNAAKILAPTQTAKASNYGVDGKVSNDVYRLPAGPLALALGLEWHHEALAQTSSDEYASGDIVGGNGAIPSLPTVTRNVFALYTEFNIPIIDTVVADVAVRWDDYSDFGSSVNPKISLRWQPTRDFLLRGAWGTGFRPPTLSDLYQPPLTTNTAAAYDDPLRCPTTHSATDCGNQFRTRQGGNPALTPEKSRQWYLGAVWDPGSSVSMGIDYYWIEIQNVITQLGAATIFGNYNAYSSYVHRLAPSPAYPDLPGEIDYVDQVRLNATRQQVSGIDLNFTGRTFTDMGKLSLNFTGSYMLTWRQSAIDDPSSFPNFVGQQGGGYQAIPRWKHNIALDWASGPYGATIAQSFQESYAQPDSTSDSGSRTVGSYSLWNLQGRYIGVKNLTLALGIKNLWNTIPPATTQVQTFQVGYDPSYADPTGRLWYGSFNYAFQ
jgi:iron complex outermembrane recepter protein